MVFVGRQRELDWLAKQLTTREAGLVPIYGRRRVGKTELIRQFVHKRPAVFHVGKVAPARSQIREFLHQLARVLDDPLIAKLPPDDWRTALEAIDRYRGDGKLIVVLDEFQWTVQASPELPSLLQELWDQRWRDANRVFVILCGSYIGFMEREVLGAKSPLYGRRTGQILLKPFRYDEASAFHPKWSTVDRACAYFVCGGVPAYLRRFDDARSFEMNLRDQVLEPESAMYREPEFLLREELREVERYFAVLTAIATGATSNRLVSQRTGIDERALHYYAQQLTELGYIERRHPLLERGKKKNARAMRYAVADPLLRFWFRFVFGEQSYLAEVGASTFFKDIVRPDLSSYFGSCFEQLCREALPALYAREGVQAPFDVGSYWDKSVQIDVVGVRDDNTTDIGECKWGSVRSASSLAAELDAKVRGFPNQRAASISRRAFVRTKPKNLPAGVVVHDLEDLYDV